MGVPATLPLSRLPFIGRFSDGQISYWAMPRLGASESAKLRARTYAAWFLIYVEYCGPAAGKWLLDQIEREMPSFYPAVDEAFLSEIGCRFSDSATSGATPVGIATDDLWAKLVPR